MIPERRGLIRVSLVILRDALGLPKDLDVRRVIVDSDDLFGDTLTLAVTGPSCPVVDPGQRAPYLKVVLQREENGRASTQSIEAEATKPATPVATVEEQIRRINESIRRGLGELPDDSRTVQGQEAKC